VFPAVAGLLLCLRGLTGSRARAVGFLTFYTRFGWLTPWVVLAAAGGWWIVLLAGRRGTGRLRAGMA
jgi:hypothetical protein